MRTVFSVVCFWWAGARLNSRAVDLLERYPTALTAGDTARPREWSFGAKDIFRLTEFHFEMGDRVRIECGVSDLAIGHCEDGAVWAVVMPRSPGALDTQLTNVQEGIAHIWLRFHPAEVNRLFPPGTVFEDGTKELVAEAGVIARAKMGSSWQGNGRALIPDREKMTVDIDTWNGVRRFFVVDRAAGSADYVQGFEKRAVKRPPAITRELAKQSFDLMWKTFDEEYAMFVLRPDVDWQALRDQFRPRAIESKSTYEFANVLAEMLKPLRDLHIWVQVAGADVPVFNRPRAVNANPAATASLVGPVQRAGREIQWTVTPEKVGYIMIRGWNDREIPAQFDKVLEQMRETRGLILDVRLNGGGGEPLAREVAGRFLEKEFVYAFSQFRNGPKHSDLTEKQPRKVSPRGPWRYGRPVVLLIGERCMSSNESFIAMMSGAGSVVTMGEHTCGSSGNPRILSLPAGITVSVPRWIDFLPDGTPLDERGFQPQVVFKGENGAFEGGRDDLLKAAMERLRALD